MLGGRAFDSFEVGTVEHDLYVMQRIRACGLQDVVMGAEETAEAFAERLLWQLIAEGKVLELIAGWLVPAGTDPLKWSPSLALQTAAHLGSLTDEEDKAVVRVLILQMLGDFFARGMVRSWRSSGSSPGANHPAGGKKGAPRTPGSEGRTIPSGIGG